MRNPETGEISTILVVRPTAGRHHEVIGKVELSGSDPWHLSPEQRLRQSLRAGDNTVDFVSPKQSKSPLA